MIMSAVLSSATDRDGDGIVWVGEARIVKESEKDNVPVDKVPPGEEDSDEDENSTEQEGGDM